MEKEQFDMQQNSLSIIKRVAFIGNYLPRQCGIATFTTDLCESPRTSIKARPVSPCRSTRSRQAMIIRSRVRFELIKGGAARTSSSRIPVSAVIWAGIGIPGLTKEENSPHALPLEKRTAPTSIMRSVFGSKPVVSTSIAVKSPTTSSQSARESPELRCADCPEFKICAGIFLFADFLQR